MYARRGLLIYTYFETSGAPINELNGSLRFYSSNGSIDIFWNNITAIQHTASHILSMTRVTFYHLILRFKTSICDFRNGQLLMKCLFRRNNWRICCQRKVDSWIGHQICLELCQINIQGSVES